MRNPTRIRRKTWWTTFCKGAIFAAAFALVCVPAKSQAPPGPIKGAPAQGAPQTPPKQQDTLRVKVEVVSAPVVVRDQKGEIIVDLTQDDFRLFDNGTEQKIDHF